MNTVLFVCTHNSARSQMAEGLLRDRYGDQYEVRSGGTEPGGVNPFAVEAMREIGIDISGHTSDHVDAHADRPLDVVVTVCDDAVEHCPYISAREQNLHHGVEDPSAVTGTDDEKRRAFRRIRDELAEWIGETFGREGRTASPRPSRSPALQPAVPDDLDAVRGLLRSCDLPAGDLTAAHLDHFLVARDEDALRGVAGLEPRGDVALLRSLAVALPYRNEGLGARLVEAIEQRARREGVRALYLLTTTAVDYFRTRGYEAIERDALPAVLQATEEAARLCPSSAVCMQKPLPRPTEEPPIAL